MKVSAVWHKLIWQKAPHNAFTDLCAFNDQLFCCFREGQTHVSADGRIRILTLDWQGKLQKQLNIALPGVDLRDPKLSVTADRKLLLLAYARHADMQNRTLHGQSVCWVSQDGISWSSPRYFGDPFWWCWRLTWHQGQAYGVAYNRQANAVRLYRGDPRRTFECIEPELFSLRRHNKGYPNESALFFDQAGTCHLLLRRDADSYSAQWGVAKPPYRRWQWQDLGKYLGGPQMLAVDDNQLLIGARIIREHRAKTALLSLDKRDRQLRLLHIFPSAGDNSYPGLVTKDDALYLSYYSSHAHHHAAIYLAKLQLSAT